MRNTYSQDGTPSDTEDSGPRALPGSAHKIQDRELDPENDNEDDTQVTGTRNCRSMYSYTHVMVSHL